MKDVLKETRERMDRAIEAFEANLATIRTGRANPQIFNRVQVNYYGSLTPLPQLANITSPDPRTLTIIPFDKSATENIEKAIRESDLGLNPNNQGDSIYVSIPALNDERRRDLVKTSKHMAEESRVSIRNTRREANDRLKKMQKDNELTEDDLRDGEEQVQKLTDDYINKIDQRLKDKEADIMEV